MTANDSFDRRLAAWLDSSSVHVVPDHLDAVLVRTIATRQRPAWSALERWLPMASPIPGTARNRRIALVAAATALLVVLAGLALGGGGRPATLGRIFVTDGTSLTSYAPDGTGAKGEAALPDGGVDISASPDGRYLVIRSASNPPHLDVLDRTTGAFTRVRALGDAPLADIGGAEWTAAGDRFAFLFSDGTNDHVGVGRPDGSVVDVAFAATGFTRVNGIDISPDGTWLAIVSQDGPAGSIALIHPDGTGARVLPMADVESGGAGLTSFSPDAAANLLLYVTAGADHVVHVVDVTTGTDTSVGSGFWPTWSPTGDRIAFWSDGIVVVDTSAALARSASVVRPMAGLSGYCPDHADRATTAWCGPVEWSPDGSRLIGVALGGDQLLSLAADGSGKPFVIPLSDPVGLTDRLAAWLRP